MNAIATISELIERLEVIRAELHPSRREPAAYEAVGWADRPLRQLIDRCREEQESQSWTEKHGRDYRQILDSSPGASLPEPRRAAP